MLSGLFLDSTQECHSRQIESYEFYPGIEPDYERIKTSLTTKQLISFSGIEEGETNEMALKRECKEEIGCDVEIIKELGLTLEYRKKYKLKQISYCYIAKVMGEKGIPKLEKDEIAEGFETVWLPIEEALIKVIESKPTIYEGQYMNARDIALLKQAIKILK